jgi:hypothetical protein
MLFEAQAEGTQQIKRFETVQNEQVNAKRNPVAVMEQKEQELNPVAHFISCFEMLEYNLDDVQDKLNSNTKVQTSALFEAVDRYLDSYPDYQRLVQSGQWNEQLEKIISQIENRPPKIDNERIESFYKISKSLKSITEQDLLEIVDIIREMKEIENEFFQAKARVEKGANDELVMQKAHDYLQTIKRIQGYKDDIKNIICRFGFDVDSPTIEQFSQEAEEILN